MIGGLLWNCLFNTTFRFEFLQFTSDDNRRSTQTLEKAFVYNIRSTAHQVTKIGM